MMKGLASLVFQIVCFSSVIIGCYGNSEERKLADLQRDYWKKTMEMFPIYSTIAGLYKYNDRVDDKSMKQMEDMKEVAESILVELKKLSPSRMQSDKAKDDYFLFEYSLSSLVKSYKWARYGQLNQISFLSGVQTAPTDFPDDTPFDTRGDYENYIARLQKLPNFYEQILGRMKEAVRLKHTFHEVSVRPVPAQFDKILKYNDEDFAFYAPLKEKLENKTDISDSEKQRMRNEGRAATAQIQRSLRKIRNYISRVYMKNTRPTLGILSLENGKELYRDLVKFYTTADLTPEEVHDKGLEEVKRIESVIKKIVKKQGFRGTVKEYFDTLKNDSRFFKKDADEILSGYRDMITNRIKPKMPSLFKDLPNLPMEVRPSPSDGPLGYYSSGPKDGSKPGIFYLNTFRPEKMITIGMMALSLHEAEPGHHYQLSVESTADIPAYRRLTPGVASNAPFEFPFYSAYVEGWALYSERLGEEIGIFKDEYELMGRYSSEMFRACRLVVDTGIHYYNWTRDRAIEYMFNNTPISRELIMVEIDRYSTWPGQALSYKIGELKILELRKKAKKELVSKFDLKEFHHVILKDGRLPFTLLESVVGRWIREVKSPKKDLCTNNSRTLYPSPIVFLAFLYCAMFS